MTQKQSPARRIHWLIAALALLLVGLPSRVSRAGDDEDKRRELMKQIEDKVRSMADVLSRLPGDSSDRPVDDARALAYEIKRLADDLEDVAGDDSDAKRIADKYPDDMDEFTGEVAPALRALKQGQNHAQPEAQMCAERDKELVRQANEYQSKNDPDGLTELPKLATQYQESTKQAIEAARRDDDKLEDAEGDADDYSADGGLRDVDSATSSAGRALYAAGHKSEEAAEKACENLLKGVDHPEVKETLAKLGNSAGGRKAIIEQLEKDARELASTLARVPDDSGLGSVERARSLLTEIERGVDTLGRNATTDKTTKLVLDKWPDAIKQLKTALDGLEHLKQHQHDLDPLPEKCKQREQELEDAIKKNGDDTDGVEDLPKVAEELAVPVRAGLEKAKERLREEERDRDLARAVTASEGPWNDVRPAEQRAADDLYKAFDDGLKKTESACENVVKGKASPRALEAVANLQKTGSSSGDQLSRDVDVWVESARATYIADCDAKKEMWQAECGSDREPSNEESDEDARDISKRLEGEMRAKMDPVLLKLPDLQKQVDALVAKRETKGAAAPLAAKLNKERERLERLSIQGRWVGANRPYNQLATDYGKEQHGRMHSSFHCDLPKDAARPLWFEDSNYNWPDCIIVTDRECKIIEFKVDSPKGHRDAAKQLAAYVRSVAQHYQAHLQDKTAPDSDYGGQAFLDRIVAAGCAGASGTGPVVFDSPQPSGAYYKMCDQPYQCIEGN